MTRTLSDHELFTLYRNYGSVVIPAILQGHDTNRPNEKPRTGEPAASLLFFRGQLGDAFGNDLPFTVAQHPGVNPDIGLVVGLAILVCPGLR